MSPAELIKSENVIAGLKAGDKGKLLSALSRRAAEALAVDGGIILNALHTREQLGSTGLGEGFALPHARLSGLSRTFGLFARLAQPIDYSAIDGKPVDLVFLLLGPENGQKEHLAALAAISRPLRDPAFRQKLRSARDGAALYRALETPPTPP